MAYNCTIRSWVGYKDELNKKQIILLKFILCHLMGQ